MTDVDLNTGMLPGGSTSAGFRKQKRLLHTYSREGKMCQHILMPCLQWAAESADNFQVSDNNPTSVKCHCHNTGQNLIDLLSYSLIFISLILYVHMKVLFVLVISFANSYIHQMIRKLLNSQFRLFC